MPGFEVIGEEENQHIQDVLSTGILMRYNFDNQRNNQWKAKELEHAIANKLETKFVHLTSSGTTALITAIKSLGIGAGDEIILPTFTFVASFEAILFTGAVPVFADVDETLTLDPTSVKKHLSSRTKAIMPVHMCGAMADLDALCSLAKEHNLFLIEDACQAIGGTYNKNYLGTIGHVGCLSFDFVKTITCGEGGAILTQNKSIYTYCQQFTDHGHDHIGKDRGAENHPIVGLNFRISELHAAVGLGQWLKLDSILSKQREMKKQLKSILARDKSIKFRKILDEEGDNASFLSFFVADGKTAKSLVNKLKKDGIPCMYWYDNNWHYYKKWEHFSQLKQSSQLHKGQKKFLYDLCKLDFAQSDEIMKRTISIPLSLNWDREKIEEIGAKIRQNLHQN